MTREGLKQIQSLIESINAKYDEWQTKMDNWAEMGDYDVPMPSLPKMVESLLFHLRGLSPKEAARFDWMLRL